MNKYTIPVEEDSEGNQYLQFPLDVLEQLGWKEGDTLNWDAQQDGTVIVTKVEPKMETEFVLVEAISQYRMRYVVEVPKGKADWAGDTVVCEEAKEFSQKHLGEVIMSERVVSKAEILEMCDEDNGYVTSWSPEKKFEAFVTGIDEYKN